MNLFPKILTYNSYLILRGFFFKPNLTYTIPGDAMDPQHREHVGGEFLYSGQPSPGRYSQEGT